MCVRCRKLRAELLGTESGWVSVIRGTQAESTTNLPTKSIPTKIC